MSFICPNTMLAQISRLHTYGRSALLLSSLLPYSTTAAAAAEALPNQSHFMTDVLINSLGFSEESALATARKVIRQKSTRKDLNLVVNFFEELGLTKTQIKSIVSVDPRVLLSDVDRALKPKIRFFQDLGLSSSDIVKVILGYKSLIVRGLDSEIRPSVEYLKKWLGSEDKVVKVVKKCNLVLAPEAPQRIEEMVLLFRNHGFSDDDISKFIVRHPRRTVLHNHEWIRYVLHLVENEFGIPCKSKRFYHGVDCVIGLSKSTIEAKLGVFRSFGWSDETINSMIRNLPRVLATAEDTLRNALNFFMKETGYTPEYLASHSMLIILNLEKRVKPRNEVLKILNEKKLNERKASLCHVVYLPESLFLRDYLLPYKDKLPHIYESYMIKRFGAETIEKP